MAISVPDRLKSLLAEVDARKGDVDAIELVGQLTNAAGPRESLTPEERKGTAAEVSGFYFTPRRNPERAVWDMYWQPISSIVDSKGQTYHQPDADLIDDEIVAYWARRFAEVRHPVLRARYADLAWEIARYRERHATPGEARPRASVDAARAAVDAYLDAVERDIVADDYRGWLFIGRALELAVGLNDRPRIDRAKALLFTYRAKLEARDPGYRFWQFDRIAWAQQKALQLTAAERGTIIDALERCLAHRVDRSRPKEFDPITAGDAAERLRQWRERAGQPQEARRAGTTAAAALEAAADDASALAATAWLGDLVGKYRQLGDTDAVARVEQKIRARAAEAKGEMRRFEHKVEIPADQLREWADRVAGETLEEGLNLIASACLLRERAIVDHLKEMAEHAPLQANIPISIMRDDGFTSAVIGSIDDDLEGRTIYQAASTAGTEAPWVHIAFERIREKHGLDLDRFVAWLERSPFLPAGRVPLVREGLAAWFAGDAVKAIHVLVPQIEAALRDLLIALGGAVTRPAQYGGGTQLITFGAILSHERFRALVPPDVRFHLRVLYTDLRGLNLRNDVSHGLAPPALFDRGIANWLVHTIVLIGILRVHTSPATSGEAGESGAHTPGG